MNPHDLAQQMIAKIEESYVMAWNGRGIIQKPFFHMSWHFFDRRLGDVVRERVFSVEAIEIDEEYQRKGILTAFIKILLEDDRRPAIPMRFIHFKDCGPDLCRLLQRLHFHRHPVGPGTDYWHPVTGQKELL
jgi:GNAT superfamily N-acetyltransferase